MAVLCIEKNNINTECMHVKCKYVVIVVCNNFTGIKFHVYQCFSKKLDQNQRNTKYITIKIPSYKLLE